MKISSFITVICAGASGSEPPIIHVAPDAVIVKFGSGLILNGAKLSVTFPDEFVIPGLVGCVCGVHCWIITVDELAQLKENP